MQSELHQEFEEELLTEESMTRINSAKRENLRAGLKDFAAIDFETANNERSSVCSVGVVIVRNGEIVDFRGSYEEYRASLGEE